jgi:hypothetical protein
VSTNEPLEISTNADDLKFAAPSVATTFSPGNKVEVAHQTYREVEKNYRASLQVLSLSEMANQKFKAEVGQSKKEEKRHGGSYMAKVLEMEAQIKCQASEISPLRTELVAMFVGLSLLTTLLSPQIVLKSQFFSSWV